MQRTILAIIIGALAVGIPAACSSETGTSTTNNGEGGAASGSSGAMGDDLGRWFRGSQWQLRLVGV
jgi:hypothetical protein